jgi:Mrp family chromosome partitioning ATPase
MSVLERAIHKAYQRQRLQPEPSATLPAEFPVAEVSAPPAPAPALPVAEAPILPVSVPAAESDPELKWSWPTVCLQLLERMGEGFRELAADLQRGSLDSARRTVAVCSVGGGEGCTTIVLMIAHAWSELDTGHCLVIDAGEEHGLCQSLGIAASPGEPPRVLIPGRLSVLAAERTGGDSRPPWLAELRRRFDLILIDAGALASSSGAPQVQSVDRLDAVVTVSSRRKRSYPAGLEPQFENWRRLGVESLGVIETFA